MYNQKSDRSQSIHNRQYKGSYAQTVAGKYKFSLSNVVYAKLAVQSVSGRPKEGDSGGVIYDKSTKKICGELQGKVTITSGNTTTYCLSFSSAEKALNALGASITWNK